MNTRSMKGWLYLIPAIAFLGVFVVYPLFDVVIYSLEEGYNSASQTFYGVGIYNYLKVLHDPYFIQALKNTFILVIVTVPLSTGIALLISVLLSSIKKLQELYQTIYFLPYVTNTLAVGLVFMILFKKTPYTDGFVNQIIVKLGGKPVNFMGTMSYFRSLYVWTGVWQSMGYSAIVYLAALTGVPQELYEAARVDGASKLRRIFSIDIPYIAPTILTLFILNTGSILSIGFEKIYLMQNSINTPVSEVISTYVYKMGVQNGNFSFSTAVGLFNSLVNLFMLLVVNSISKKLSNVSVL